MTYEIALLTQLYRRKHLIRRQDLHNIKAQYNIDGIMRHKNDLTSVLAWVEEMNALEYNPVLVFKLQGIDQCDTTDKSSQR